MTEQLAPPTDGGSIPTPSLHFLPLEKLQAISLIIENHYLHRRCPISWAWGIKNNKDNVLGVLTVGKPCSWSAVCGLVGEKKNDLSRADARWHDVYELNRLWVSDSLPRNTESRFIGWCLKQLKKIHPGIILLSYADSSQGHIGYVYQATNWIYTGSSAIFTDLTLPGYSDHRSIPKNKRIWDSPDVIRLTRSRKHRYVWFSNIQDKKLLKRQILPYPKT